MQGHSFVQQSKLGNVAGRIGYISSHARQEYLYAKYDTADRDYWRQLAKECQQEFRKSGTEGKCIEARELIIALPRQMFFMDHNKLLKVFTDQFKSTYGVECCSALHHNKSRTNFHIHLIYSERKLLEEPVIKIATRNMYYDETGKHVRAKKEVTENGNLRAGCQVISKGQAYEERYFEKKIPQFKSKTFLDEVKHMYTDLINEFVDERFQLQVFNADSPYLPTRKIGKNNPIEKEIKEDNQVRDFWNANVNIALNMGMPLDFINRIKAEVIDEEIYESVKASRTLDAQRNKDNPHESFRGIVLRAGNTLRRVAIELARLKPEEIIDVMEKRFKEFLDKCRAPKQSGKIRDKDEYER